MAMVLGLASGKVSLVRAHAAWAVAYQQERVRILAALSTRLLDIQHVGSTAIPNVAAKPILDILIGVRDFDEAAACVEPMIEIGYRVSWREWHSETPLLRKGRPSDASCSYGGDPIQ